MFVFRGDGSQTSTVRSVNPEDRELTIRLCYGTRTIMTQIVICKGEQYNGKKGKQIRSYL